MYKRQEEWIEKIRERARATGDTGEDVLELLDMIERGFDDIEHRISNMDKEHSKYVRATVTRLNYLLSGESDTKGLVIQLLNRMAEDDYEAVSYTHLRAHETRHDLVCRLLLEKKKNI